MGGDLHRSDLAVRSCVIGYVKTWLLDNRVSYYWPSSQQNMVTG